MASYLMFPPHSWGLRWYQAMLANRALIGALWVSLGIAGLVTTIGLFAGLPAACAIRRCEFRAAIG